MNFYKTDMKVWNNYDVSDINFNTKFDYKTQCVVCSDSGNDSSGDNLHVYSGNGGAHCFACSFSIPSEETILSDGDIKSGNSKEVTKLSNVVIKDLLKLGEKRLNKEDVKSIVETSSADPKGWRGLKAKYIKDLNIRFKYDDNSNLIEMLTGVTFTESGKTDFVGFKSRKIPKDFSSPKGYVGSICDLIGYKKFKNSNRTLVIVEGEVDFASAHQMYQMDMESKGKKYELPAVCSVVNGSASLLKTFKDSDTNFKFFKQFDRVILAFDSDDAGNKAVDEFIEEMPRENLYRANLRYKDANDYLQKDAYHEWVSDTYWNVTPCSVGKIVGSGDWLMPAQEELNTPRLRLSPIYKGINDATRGGFPMGRYVILAGASSVGKTVHINTMIYDWVFEEDHKIGIVSLELSQGQYYVEMLSRHVGLNIEDIQTNEERANLLNNPELIEAGNSLFRKENGEDRFYVVDDRDSDITNIQQLCEDLVVKKGVNVLVLDPISDLTQRLDNTHQVVFNSWVKSFIKKHNVLMIGISHVKKGDKNYDNGDVPDEGDLIGSYSGASSAAAIFFFSRNKMSDDIIEKNTTLITTPKIRWTGRTGVVDKIYFEHKTRRLMNYDDYLKGYDSSPTYKEPDCLNEVVDTEELPDWC